MSQGDPIILHWNYIKIRIRSSIATKYFMNNNHPSGSFFSIKYNVFVISYDFDIIFNIFIAPYASSAGCTYNYFREIGGRFTTLW